MNTLRLTTDSSPTPPPKRPAQSKPAPVRMDDSPWQIVEVLRVQGQEQRRAA